MADFVTLDNYFTSQEAHLVKNKLEAAGIECVILNELSAQIYNFHAPANGGILLKVRKNDLQTAQDLLATDMFGVEIDEDFEVGFMESEAENDSTQAIPLQQGHSWLLLLLGLVILVALAYLIASRFGFGN